MNPPDDPDSPDDVSADWTGFALNIGFKLAETFGLGLTLFNALRDRFAGVPGSILGSIASTIGQAIRAATGLTAADFNRQLGSMELPIVPASWNEGEPGDRVGGRVDITATDADGNVTAIRQVFVNGLEQLTPQDIIEEAVRLFEEALNETNPKVLALIAEKQAQIAALYARF